MQKSEQYPHVEVLSRNRVNRSTIIVAVIPVTLFSGVFIYAIWSFLWLLAYMALVLLSISFLYLVALMAINVYHKWIEAHVIHLGEYGAVDVPRWRMLPLALPAPVIVTEQPKDDDELSRSKALLYHDIGWSIQRIAKEIDVKPWKVQQWTSQYEQAKEAKKRTEAKQTHGA